MYAIVAQCRVKPERLESFLEAVRDDARGSIENEPGCLRFDVVQDRAEPTRLYLYEVYRDQQAFEAHLQTPHFRRWAEAVEEWYQEPIQVSHCTPVFLTDQERRA